MAVPVGVTGFGLGFPMYIPILWSYHHLVYPISHLFDSSTFSLTMLSQPTTESSTDGTLDTDSPPDSPFPSSPSSLSLSNPNSYHITPATSPAPVTASLPATAPPTTSQMVNQDTSLIWEGDEDPK